MYARRRSGNALRFGHQRSASGGGRGVSELGGEPGMAFESDPSIEHTAISGRYIGQAKPNLPTAKSGGGKLGEHLW